MLAGENSLEDEIENILGKDFLDPGLNSQSQSRNNGLGAFYKELLTLLMNEQHSPELLKYDELLIESIREKIDLQVTFYHEGFR